MARAYSLIAGVILLLSSPALAREERQPVDVPAVNLDDAIRALARQTGSSIGYRDRRLTEVRVRRVNGEMTVGEALVLMLRGTGLRPRRVAANSFLIERDPDFSIQKRKQQQDPARPTPPVQGPSPLPPIEPIEIIVTATKRDVPISAYPGMVHVIEGDRVSVAFGRQGTDALGSTTTSVVSTHQGQGRNKLFIRGIADSSFVGPTQATVGQYWGHSRITYASPDPSLRLYDVGRIEVLEGPQGTLYGAGSLGGIVRVVPQAPKLDRAEGVSWAGVETVSHGSLGFDGGGVLNVPLVEDRLAVRAVAFGTVESGYIDDVGRDLADINDVDSVGGRLAARFDDGDGLSVDASVVGQIIEGADSQYAERIYGNLARSSRMAQPFSSEFLLADLAVSKDWNDMQLTLSTAYADQLVYEEFEGLALADVNNTLIGPAFDAPQVAYTQRNHGSMVTAEARLARNLPDGTGWLVAASFLRNEAETVRSSIGAGETIDLTGVQNTVDEATVYGEATFALSKKIKMTAGGRLTMSHLTGKAITPVQSIDTFGIEPSADDSRTETEFLPSLSFAYQLNEDLTGFLRYQEGYRPGGIAVRREFIQKFAGDSVQTIEAGTRYRSEKFEVESSISWTDWKNIQADLVDGYGFPTTTNVGDGRILSFGLSGRWRPVARLELEGSFYLNKSKVTQPSEVLIETTFIAQANGDSGPLNTERLPNIADRMGMAGLSWWTPLDDRTELELRAYGRYVGKSVLGIGPLLGKLQGDYFDNGVEAQLVRGDTRLSLALTNILDATGNRFALGSPFQIRNADQITPLKPRSLRIGVQFSF